MRRQNVRASKPDCLGHPEAAVLAAPLVERRVRNPVPAAKIHDLHPGIRLLEDLDDLRLAEPTLPHDDDLLGRRHELLTGTPQWGKVRGISTSPDDSVPVDTD